MKMTTEHYADVRLAMRRILDANPTIREQAAEKGFTERRLAWDLFHATRYNTRELYAYLNDANIETALIKILREGRS